MKMYGGVEVSFIIFNLDSEWCKIFVTAALPRGIDPDTHWIGDCMGPTASLGAVKGKMIPTPTWNRTPTVQPAGDSVSDLLSSYFQANTGKSFQIDAVSFQIPV
jgi:hypothetical protein